MAVNVPRPNRNIEFVRLDPRTGQYYLTQDALILLDRLVDKAEDHEDRITTLEP